MELRCVLASGVAIAAIALLAAGCGSGGSPRVANVASTTTAHTTTGDSGAVAFSRCMRSNGVPTFPDPAQLAQLGAEGHKPTADQLGVSESRFQAAANICRHLLPNGGQSPRPTITPADRADYLRAAACMRSHGVPNFPDPTFQNNNVTFNVPSNVNTNSPVAIRAVATCRKLIPAGLPYSNGSSP